ncbi:hypothetical protein FXO37_07148 [Capsicum annuum]|nr:hypothetical protein FXO37_07148 [Capsicum annuum]
MDEIPFEQRVKIASIHMEGEAIAWHRSYVRSRNSTAELSWTEYVLALNERFGEGFEDAMEALKKLTQTVKKSSDVQPIRYPRFNGNNTRRRLTSAEMDEKRAKGLCFFCDEKYVMGHKCATKKQIYLIDVVEDDQLQKVECDEAGQEVVLEPKELMTISLQAYTGISGYQTIRVTGYHEKMPLQWLLQDTTFSSDFLLLPLGNVDIVLGVQWLSTLGRILFDFSSRTIEFRYQGKKHVLKGATNKLKTTKSKTLIKQCEVENQLYMLSLIPTDYAEDLCYNIQTDQEDVEQRARRITVEPGTEHLNLHSEKIQPTSEDVVKRFLGLAGYYRRFIKGFGVICRPLHDPLKKDGFTWSVQATEAFDQLKKALITAPVLAMPDYTKIFLVETDASGKGIGAVLIQEGHPIAFISRSLAPKHQVAGITKLMAFDFTIKYKKWAENKVVDALSRKPEAELLAISLLTHDEALYASIQASWQADTTLQEVIHRLQVHPFKFFTWLNDKLRWKERLVVGKDLQLRKNIITLWHAKPQGLLQPLPVPDGVWTDTCMDFIEGLPKVQGKEVILVVVDRLSKSAHFISLQHPYTAQTIAQCFMDHIFKLHGLPSTLTSDRDLIFVSSFWQELFGLFGVKVQHSTAYHPQTNGQTEVLNRTLETYLRCFCSDKSKEWVSYFPLAEWWYNTTDHTTLKCTPYEVLYGQKPPIYLPYLAGESGSDMSLIAREAVIQLLKFHILRAQQRMKDTADKHRSDRSFEVGDWVYLKIQPYR